jgi:hypothetical protein
MTRIFTDGAEMGDVLFWDYQNLSINTVPRSGTYNYSTTYGNFPYKTISPLSEFYIRYGFKYTYIYDGGITWAYDATTIGRLVNAGGGLSVAQVGTTTVGTTITPFVQNVWYLIEIHVKLDNTSGILQVKINGVPEVDYAGDTLPDANTTVNRFYIYDWGGEWDDFALNDTNGTIDNSWCGNGHVVKITPSGSGTTNNWLNSGSVSGSANYLYVDEYPNDGDTTYVYLSGSSLGVQDQYAMSAFTSGCGVIKRIFPECRAKKLTADFDEYIKVGYLPEGGTDQVSGSSVLTTSYARIVGTSASANPVTGLAWTDSDINALEFVCEI